jgi:hypothetical protein
VSAAACSCGSVLSLGSAVASPEIPAWSAEMIAPSAARSWAVSVRAAATLAASAVSALRRTERAFPSQVWTPATPRRRHQRKRRAREPRRPVPDRSASRRHLSRFPPLRFHRSRGGRPTIWLHPGPIVFDIGARIVSEL